MQSYVLADQDTYTNAAHVESIQERMYLWKF